MPRNPASSAGRPPLRRRLPPAERRVRILEGALPVFARDGYAATSMAELAAEANVALKTVYLAFETKSGVLRALWNRLLRGGREEVPVAEQPWYREVVEERDPERQLRLNARNSAQAKERIGPILDVIRNATSVDPDIKALWNRIESDYHANQGVIVASIAEKKALRRGLSVERATDILWTINHPTVWQLLVRGRGWTADEYEQWCADTTCDQLLDERRRRRGGRTTRGRAPAPQRRRRP